MLKALREIPLLEAPAEGLGAIVESRSAEMADILGEARRHYTAPVLVAGDRLSRAWLRRSQNPYLGEIDAIAGRLDGPGGYLLNLSFEWSCTTATGPAPGGKGNRLLRTLDWLLPGLGRTLLVVRQQGAAGTYLNITWPGFVGVATAMAPGRFSAALNQPPMRRNSALLAFDWLLGRSRLAVSRALPPVHLLRRVFDSCRTFAEAKRLLVETPLCMPAFFTLSGATAEEGCIIERTETRAAVRESPACVANHWVDLPHRCWPRGGDSVGRLAAMTAGHCGATEPFAWLTPPILNPTTRVAVEANAGAGSLLARGYEADGPVTRPFAIG